MPLPPMLASALIYLCVTLILNKSTLPEWRRKQSAGELRSALSSLHPSFIRIIVNALEAA